MKHLFGLIAAAILFTLPSVDADIFSELWELDQQHHGLSVTIRNEDGQWKNPNAAIRLDEGSMSLDPRRDYATDPLLVVQNPEKLRGPTYRTIQALFDNYIPDETKPEDRLGENPAEDAEIDAFLNAALKTAVLKRALAYVNESGWHGRESDMTETQFHDLLKQHWFQTFTNHYSNPKPHCSGFEHVIVGDHNSQKIGGHHFWWKFYLDQQAGTGDSLGHKYLGPAGEAYPLLATFRMKWQPEPGVVLTEPIQKGFFVGCSPELMLAYGTLAMLYQKQNDGQHPVVTLHGGKFQLVVYPNTLPGPGEADDRRGNHIRTTYPRLLNVAGTDQGQEVDVASALKLSAGTRVRVTGLIKTAHNSEFGLQLVDQLSDEKFLAVKLPKAFRLKFNPVQNRSAVGKRITVQGRLGKYTGITGVVEVTSVTVNNADRKPGQ